ncbi:hypothetical protein DOY81_011475 [Sarcophaga bullata]|nr:hypothetical protein DOY81_011475 [Sarcophaga bullata]
MLPLKPVSLLTCQYLRRMGLPQAIPIGTGYTHICDCSARPIFPEKVRMGFIPESWFEFFYPKTGVTGPYLFGLGLLNYLFSKEIYVCEHEFYSGLSLGIMCIVIVKKLGPKVANYCDREVNRLEEEWKKQKETEINDLKKLIEREEVEQWRAGGALRLMDAKKDNIALQLETAYRLSILDLHKEMERRLNYHVKCYYTEKRILRKHMAKWLIKECLKEIPKDIDDRLRKHYVSTISAYALSYK